MDCSKGGVLSPFLQLLRISPPCRDLASGRARVSADSEVRGRLVLLYADYVAVALSREAARWLTKDVVDQAENIEKTGSVVFELQC